MASREPGGYAVTPPLGGRDFHPHRDISYQGSLLAFHPPDRAGFGKNVSHTTILDRTATSPEAISV